MKLRNLIFVLLLSSCNQLYAQCWNTVNPSCGVYESCFNKYCNCTDTSFEYSLSYGKYYCKAFLEIDGLSNAGKVWRDATLRCLQEALVPLIPIEENASCNCKELKRFAYSSHVSCYTQNTQSICDLPYEDIVLIGKTILFNKNVVRVFKDYEAGYRQVYDLFSKCSKTAKDEKTRQKWKFNHRLLMGQWMTINPN